MKVLLTTLLILIGSSRAHAQASNYPISWISFPKAFLDPLSDPEDCGSGGLIARLMCRFKEFGVEGLGTSHGRDGLGNYYTVTVSELGSEHEFKLEAWVDHTTRDGSNNRKFLNYWFSDGGRFGRIEMLPDLPESTPVWESTSQRLLIEWDSSDPESEELVLFLHKQRDDSSQEWDNRDWALKISMESNRPAGTVRMSMAVNYFAGGASRGFGLEVARSSELTLVHGTEYEADGSTLLASHPYECVRNEGIEVLDRADDLQSVVQANASCEPLQGLSSSSMDLPSQEALDLFSAAEQGARFTLSPVD